MVKDDFALKAWDAIPEVRDKGVLVQRGESSKAFNAFCIYRDMPYRAKDAKPRSMQKVADELGQVVQNIQKWSTPFSWLKRAAQYDVYMEGIRREEQELQYLEMKSRQIRTAQMLQTKGIAKLAQAPAGELTVRDAISAIKDGVMLERLAFGESTENVNQHIKAEATISQGVVGELFKSDEYKRNVRGLLESIRKKHEDCAESEEARMEAESES